MIRVMRARVSRAATATRKNRTPARPPAARRLERLEIGYRDLRSEVARIRAALDAALGQGGLSLATVDPASLDSVRRFEAWRLQEAERRLREAMSDLRAAEVIDAKGRRVNRGIPEDMKEGTGCDL